ncbi:transcription factor [Ganoderma sinense ZZ0214-1]|uniref:Transcription factor n=1 Tax=Ganoderma sinense ZZ0214-1 TaxID=1077348 RepID=A0A2G8SPM7_9APHY|nr:transcription factor [Ganoderma sinense ZZ0214-1]
MASHPNHPPHPQFLDVDWPRNHEPIPTQPLQLENEYDIDPSRYDILQGELQPGAHVDRRRHAHNQSADFMMNNFGGRPQQFGGSDDYVFTFPGTPSQQQQQQFSQVQYGGNGGQQFYPDTPYSGVSTQSMPSSPYYPDDVSVYSFGQPGPGMGMGQHARSNSNPNPGVTPTIRTFQQGDVARTPVYSNVPSPMTPNFVSSQNYGLAMQQAGLPFRGDAGSGMPHASKRMRALDDGEGEASSADGDGHEESGARAKEESAKPPKPLGACARCKGLKVKCEFKTDPDICKRCLNGGHECVIPGRKKRRAPPRRDLLLGQIREQAGKIEELMKQLEEANERAARKASGEGNKEPSPSVDSASNTDKDTSNMSASASELTASDIGTPEQISEQITKPDVLDWIAKARESIEAFGGYINMGGPSVTQDLVGEDVLGWKDSSDDSYDELSGDEGGEEWEDAKSDFHVEVEDVDAKKGEPQRGRSRPGELNAEAKEDDRSSVTRSSRRKKSRGGLTREKLAILPNEAAPIGMLANLSLRKSRSRKSSRSRSVSTVDSNEYGVANDDYFRATSPGPDRPIMYAQHQTPYILRSGLVSPAEVEKLFKIYFEFMSPSLSLLDPILYTAQKTYWRSPFLFTVICGIASKFYSDRPDLYQQAMNCARLAAGSTLIGGQKSVETVHAYILLSQYPVPARKWEESRCWVYMGLAMRIATDLNLHLPNTAEPHNQYHAREMLNRTRVWLNCFMLDRVLSSQYGKAPIISNTDYVANHAESWYNSSPCNIPGYDIHLCAYNAELKCLADFRLTIFSDPSHPVGLNNKLDFTAEASKTDDELARLWETWIARIREEGCHTPATDYRTSTLKLVYSYGRMTVLSFAFQHTHARETSQGFDDAFFWRCLRASKDLIRTLLDELSAPHQRVFLRHGPDAQCVFVAFTCAFLIKLLHPRFVTYIPRDTRVEIRGLVQDVANFLGSPEVALDDRHGPMMYSRFLHGLLETPLASVDHSPAALKRAARLLSPQPPPQPDHADDHQPSQASSSTITPTSNTHSQSNPAPPHDPHMYDSLGMQFDSQSTQPADTSGMYAAPLPFDNDLLQSMQTLTDSNWSNMILPGFNWMDAMQQDSDVQMRYNPDIRVSSSNY